MQYFLPFFDILSGALVGAPVLAGGLALLAVEQAGEVQGVLIPHRAGDVGDGQIRVSQQGAGLADAHVQQIGLGDMPTMDLNSRYR